MSTGIEYTGAIGVQNKMPIMCILWVHLNISEERIRRVFEELNLGMIERVDMVPITNQKGDNFNRVFIHMRWNISNPDADKLRQMLLNEKQVQIVYDEPWYWKVSAYKKKPSRYQPVQHKPVTKPTIRYNDTLDNLRYVNHLDQRINENGERINENGEIIEDGEEEG